MLRVPLISKVLFAFFPTTFLRTRCATRFFSLFRYLLCGASPAVSPCSSSFLSSSPSSPFSSASSLGEENAPSLSVASPALPEALAEEKSSSQSLPERAASGQEGENRENTVLQGAFQ